MSLADRIDADLAAQLGHGNDQAVTDARKLLAEIVADIQGGVVNGCTCPHPTYPDFHRKPRGDGWRCERCRCGRHWLDHGHTYKPNPLDHEFDPCPCTGENE